MNDELSAQLIAWYGQQKRELPWRETLDPYLIWISEVILQQTRVAQGLDYYYRFTERFPTVEQLAQAQEDEVLKMWQGLGYYSRARSLHTAARDVVARFGGVFPRAYSDVITLKGVGEYTAAAICSFAYGDPHAVVDGNVYRLLSRLFAWDVPIDSTIGKRDFASLAQNLLNPKQAALHNQAIMEFGALQCVPSSPDCTRCPLQGACLAYAQGRVGELPVKAPKKAVTARYFNYLHIRLGEQTFLQQRTARDIWQNLYQFPLIETAQACTFEELEREPAFRELMDGVGEVHLRRQVEMPRHLLSHRAIFARFYELEITQASAALEALIEVKDHQLQQYAVSRLIESYLEK